MEPIDKQGINENVGLCSRIKGRIRVLFHIHPTPRILLFFVAILIKIVASALGGIGFVWNNSTLMIIGTVVWLIWFAFLFLIAVPKTDQLLQDQMRWLKPAALTISISFLVTGLVLLVAVSSFGLGAFQVDKLGEKPAQLITSFEGVFAYNDATALCHQATENLIDGNNPYAESNVIAAMMKYVPTFLTSGGILVEYCVINMKPTPLLPSSLMQYTRFFALSSRVSSSTINCFNSFVSAQVEASS